MEVKPMSLQPTWNEEVPEDTVRAVGHLLPEDSVYRLIGDEVQKVLSTEAFTDMYSKLGRGAIHPIILTVVTILQFLENIPDRVAAMCAVMRMDWKYALHVPLDWEGFDHSTLSYFRRRLLEHQQERQIFDQVLQWVQKHGFLKKHGKQRSDSTHILGQVARLTRLELVWETLRMALRAMQKKEGVWYKRVLPIVFHKAYNERQSSWRMSAAEVAAEMQKAGTDGHWLLELIEEHAPQPVRELAEVETLRQVLAQQFECQEDKVQVRKPPIKGKETIQSPHDPDARFSKKRSTKWVGYKAQITETAYSGEDNFLTDIETVDANDDDSEAVDGIHARLEQRKLKPEQHYVDQGYISGANIAHSSKRGVELVGPIAADTSRKPKGFKQADFALDFESQVATCPNGQTSVSWLGRPQKDGHVGAHVLFRHKCATCPDRADCAPGKSGRSLEVSAYYAEITARRAEVQTDAFKEQMKHRPAVEGTLSEMVRKHGFRRARYRGKKKTRLQHLFTGAAVNLKRLARALAGRRQTRKALATGC
jgi:transposase